MKYWISYILKLSVIIAFLQGVCFAESKAVEENGKYNKYFLNVGYFSGSQTDDSIAEEILLYDKPISNGRILHRVKIKDFNHSSELYKLFDDNKSVFYFLNISSTEKRNEFYKVFYRGKYYWVPESNFIEKKPILEYMRQVNFSVPLSSKLFEKPGGKIVYRSLNWVYRKETYREFVRARIIDHKYISETLWLKLKFDPSEACLPEQFKKDLKPFEGWYMPYEKNGKPLWSYPHKGGC